MSFLAWNCRGLNNSDSPAIPYLVWLTSKFKPHFLFLQETKTIVDNVHRLLRSTNPSVCYGVDANETRGGLVLFSWGRYVVDIIESSGYFLLCKITEINGQEWHCLFLYGAPYLSLRLALWNHLHQLLSKYDKILILGDVNQSDRYEDKMGGSAMISGWDDFMSWKMALNLHDLTGVMLRLHGYKFFQKFISSIYLLCTLIMGRYYYRQYRIISLLGVHIK